LLRSSSTIIGSGALIGRHRTRFTSLRVWSCDVEERVSVSESPDHWLGLPKTSSPVLMYHARATGERTVRLKRLACSTLYGTHNYGSTSGSYR
jgi:hypothetical protein